MSDIQSLETVSPYAPTSLEAKRTESETAESVASEEIQAPQVKASEEQQDFKTTVNGFQYTGKGAIFDHMI